MTAVPALQRGFAILELLNQHDAMSLEEITVATDFPRASILRMLETMCELGVICKMPENKKYRAMSLLMPRAHGFKQRLRSVLNQLAEQSDACVEWYLPHQDGMRIAERFSAPENEVQVHARIGFTRAWYDELEAVAAIALSCTDKGAMMPTQQKLWVYDSEGEHRYLNKKEIKQILEQTKHERFFCDPLYNSNGVKRMAAPVRAEGKLRGIVAIAFSYRPQLHKLLPKHQQALQQAIKKLEQ